MIPDVIKRVALLGWHCYPRASHHRAAAFTGAAQQATCNLAALDRWACEYPNCGWYAVTGSSGIWALDVDAPPKADGVTALAQLTKHHGAIAPRPTIRTGGGGLCLIFHHNGEPLRGQSGTPASGLDPKRGAQTITLPPTVHHATGRPYEWLQPPWVIEPPQAPAWLLKALAPPPEPVVAAYPYTITHERAQRALYRAVDRLRNSSEGSRNDALNRSAFHIGTLIAGGLLPHRDAEDALMRAAMQAGLPRSEITATLRSALRAARGFAVS